MDWATQHERHKYRHSLCTDDVVSPIYVFALGGKQMARKTATAIGSYLARLNDNKETAVKTMREEIDSINTTNVGREAGTVSANLETALNNAIALGDIAFDRPRDPATGKYLGPEISGFLHIQPKQVMNGLCLVKALARLEANQVLFNAEKSDIAKGVVVTQTAEGVATYSGRPEEWVTEFTIDSQAFVQSTSKSVTLKGWNGNVIPVAQAVSHKGWDETFRYYRQLAILGAQAAHALNMGKALEDLSPEEQAVVATGETFKMDTTGQWYVPAVPEHNFLPPTALHSWFLAQRYLRSLDTDFSHRIGAVVWGATDLRVAQGKADRDALKAMIIRRYSKFYNREVARIQKNELDDKPTVPVGVAVAVSI